MPQLMLPVMTTRQLRELGYPAFAFNHLEEREDKIIGKKEVKTEYYSESKELTYFVIEEVEEESIVKLIEKMLVNIILTGCNCGLC
ncbi:MAG: hypothetical protein IJE45_03050 [Bacilli bacterium]|nr:hypothetical protein [Bacilli bacterium]